MADSPCARKLNELTERFRRYEETIRAVDPDMADTLHGDGEATITMLGTGRVSLTIPADEPIFILRAQDRLALQTIATWCAAAKKHQVPAKKIAAAEATIEAMLEWREHNIVKTPD